MKSSEKELMLEFSESVCRRVRLRMKRKKINQRELAYRMGQTEAQISRTLNGSQNLTIHTIAKLSIALDNFKLIR